jgi:flagellar hook-basal body complex protein FliE
MDVHGHRISLATSDPRHIAPQRAGYAASRLTPDGGPWAAPQIAGSAGSEASPAAAAESSFGKLFFQALGQVNDQQVRAQDLSQALITDPESVDIHDVTIALAEANLSLSMTKAVIDRAIRAYREIVNIR